MDAERSSDLFMRRLGFRISDQTGMMHFLRCNADHHSIAFARTGNTSVNHIAFEMPSWDGLMRGAGRVKQACLLQPASPSDAFLYLTAHELAKTDLGVTRLHLSD